MKPLRAVGRIAFLLAALGLLVSSAVADPPAKTGTVLGRLIRGQSPGASSLPGGSLHQAELEHYARRFAIDLASHPPMVRVWMRLGPDGRGAVESLGIPVVARAGNLVSAKVPLPRLEALAKSPAVEWIRAKPILHAELDVSVPEVGADLAHDAYWARGAGVVVGIIDDGIDFTHDDFRNPDGTTRIKYLWNQWLICGNPPAGFGYGCLYTEADINDALDMIGTVQATDSSGHGSHVAGVAAGNGRGTGNGQPAGTYVGMAPGADLVIVKLTDNLISCGNCDLGDALSFIDEKAAVLGKPWVANASVGQNDGAHDGSDPDEIFLDTLIGAGIPGKAIVKSAGNNGGSEIHISGAVSGGSTNSHDFTLPAYTPLPGTFNDVHTFNLFYESGDTLTVELTSPGSSTTSLSTGGGQNGLASSDGVFFIDDTGSPTALGTRLFFFELDDQAGVAPAPGTWTLDVTGGTITAGGGYDAWITFSELGAGKASADWDAPDVSNLITLPGTAFGITTVGAHISRTDWIDVNGVPQSFPGVGLVGDIAGFSSPGPTRDQRTKPDVSAPGQFVASSLASNLFPFDEDVTEDGQHWLLAGTSFSAPHVTGLYAQMLGLNPNLDAIELRTILQETARTDGFTGAVPNIDFGHGKLDAKAALDLVAKHVNDLIWTTTTQYVWGTIPAVATSYNVYRARISQLDETFYGNCRAQGLTTPLVNEGLAPPLGDGFFYLITGVKDGLEGVRGFRSDGTVRPSNAVCN